MEAEFEVHLANTAAIQQYSGLKYGDDDNDANWLANMLRLAILPTGYIYPKEARMQRDLLRKRMQCSGLIEPDTLIRDNIYQLLRCRNGTKTNEQAVF
jgi:hypothetical protein